MSISVQLSQTAWREPSSQQKAQSIGEENHLPGLETSCDGQYVFSHAGWNREPLALIGTSTQIKDWLTEHAQRSIVSETEHPELYCAVGLYKEGHRFDGSFASQPGFAQACSFLPGLENQKDPISTAHALLARLNHPHATINDASHLYIRIADHPIPEGAQIGEKRITFGELYRWLKQNRILA